MKRPRRFSAGFLPDRPGVMVVSGAELHHMRDVCRLRTGAQVSLLGPDGAEVVAKIVQLGSRRALAEVVERRPAPASFPVVLAAAIIKGSRMDFMVEKAAELGAAELWLMATRRGVVPAPGAERRARWERLAAAAARQSLAPAPMAIRAALSVAEVAAKAPPEALRLVCVQGGAPLGGILKEDAARALVVACGPEGDFAPEELAALRGAGFVPCGLGPNRLRAETAALAALSVVLASRAGAEQGD